MEFTIISIGSSELLTEVLNGLAMIMGTGDVDRAAGSALLAFCLWSGVKYTMNPSSGMPWAQCLVGMIMFACFFGPSVTVVVEDAYSGKTTVTDNIPVGPAAAGSFLSHVGYGLTQIMEQGYGTVTDTGRVSTGGFVDPLKSLVALRREDVRNMSFKLADQELPSIYDSRKTVENYMRYCTARKPGLEGESAMKNVMSDQLPDALYLNSSYYTTMVMDSVTGTLKTCKEAQADISSIYSKITDSSSIERAFQTLSGTNTSAEDVGTDSRLVRLQDFLASFSATTAANTKDLFAAGIMYPLMESARAGHLKDGMDVAASAAINSAIQTRNAQWAYEGSSFLQTMRPMMAILEAIVYAISPIAAIIVVMGSAGMAMVGKYMQMIFWLQLWMPMMSIINLYSINSAAEKFYQMTGYDSEMQLGSFYAFNNYSTMAEAYTSTAGMMLGAVPLLAMMIATGSIYTLNSLAGRMTSPDTFDEGRISANPGKAPTLLNQAPISSYDQASGLSATGASSGLGSYNVSQIASSAHSRAQAKSAESTQAFSQSLSAAHQSSATEGYVNTQLNSIAGSDAFTSTEGYSKVDQAISSVTDGMGMSTGRSHAINEAVKVAMAAGISGQAGLKKLGGLSAGGTSTFADEFNSSEEFTNTLSSALNQVRSMGISEQDQASLTSGFQNAWQKSSASSMQSSETNSQTSALNQQATQAYKDSQTAQSTQGIVSSYGQANSVTREQAAMRILNDQDANAGLNQVFDAAAAKNPLMREAMQRERDHLTSGPNGVNTEKAEAIAKFSALTGLKNYSNAADGSYANNISSLQNAGVMAAAFGETFNPGSTATIAGSISPAEANGNANAGIVGSVQSATAGTQSFSAKDMGRVAAGSRSGYGQQDLAGDYASSKQEFTQQVGQEAAAASQAAGVAMISDALNIQSSEGPKNAAAAGDWLEGGWETLVASTNTTMGGDVMGREGQRQAQVMSVEDLQQFKAAGQSDGFWESAWDYVADPDKDLGEGAIVNNLDRMPAETRAAFLALSDEDQAAVKRGFSDHVSQQSIARTQHEASDQLLQSIDSMGGDSALKSLILAEVGSITSPSSAMQEQYGVSHGSSTAEQAEIAYNTLIDNGMSEEQALQAVNGARAAAQTMTLGGEKGYGGSAMRYIEAGDQFNRAEEQRQGNLYGNPSSRN
tara:strand:- start:11860 stop:15381 length:3522 start_codon:yes stop_codon:yes gene_type:complete